MSVGTDTALYRVHTQENNMYQHKFKVGDKVTIQVGAADEMEGTVVKLWNSPYITVQDQDGYKYAGPEYTATRS